MLLNKDIFIFYKNVFKATDMIGKSKSLVSIENSMQKVLQSVLM